MKPDPVWKTTTGLAQLWEEDLSSSLNKIQEAIGQHKMWRSPCIQQRIFRSMSREVSSEFLLFFQFHYPLSETALKTDQFLSVFLLIFSLQVCFFIYKKIIVSFSYCDDMRYHSHRENSNKMLLRCIATEIFYSPSLPFPVKNIFWSIIIIFCHGLTNF